MKVLYERVKQRPPYRTLKGGSCYNTPQFCRAAYRGIITPGYRDDTLGLRPIIRIKRLG